MPESHTTPIDSTIGDIGKLSIGDRLYAWTSSIYYDINNPTKHLTVYTLSATPAIGDAVYTETGDFFSGRCYSGAETASIGSHTIQSVSGDTITLGGK